MCVERFKVFLDTCVCRILSADENTRHNAGNPHLAGLDSYMRLKSVFKRAALTVAFTSALCSSESAQNTSSGARQHLLPGHHQTSVCVVLVRWQPHRLRMGEPERNGPDWQVQGRVYGLDGTASNVQLHQRDRSRASQAVHMKAALGPNTAVFSYQSAWLAARFYLKRLH